MEKRKYTYTQLGMLLGIVIGGGIAVILFGITGNAISFAIIGVVLVIGLILGSGFDQRKLSQKDE